MMEILFNISNTDNADVPVGKMKISGTNSTGFACNVFVRFVYSTGDVIPLTQIATNIANAATFENVDLSIPVDSDGNILSGVFDYYIIFKKVSDGTTVQTVAITSGGPKSYAAFPTEIATSESINLLDASFTLEDNTVVSSASGVANSRLWTITKPTILTTPGAVVTSTASSVKTHFTHLNAAFNVLLVVDTVITREGDIDMVEEYELTTQFDFTPRDPSLCPLKDCINSEIERFKTALCRAGGIDKMLAQDRNRMQSLLLLVEQHQLAIACLDYGLAQAIYDEIKAKFTCSQSTESSAITAYILPNGSTPTQTAWETISPILNSFAQGSPALRWRVSGDNELRIIGKVQCPAGLTDLSSTIVASGFINVSIANMMTGMKFPAIDVNGNNKGYFSVDTSGDLLYSPITTSLLEFLYVNITLPLD